VRDAQAVARRLDIPHAVLDLASLFREKVVDDFVSEYGRGRTPNPCVQCNTHVKFAPLLDWARRNGYDHIATGHYARLREVELDGQTRCLIARAVDDSKDQSYVLWGVPPEVLRFTRFPLGGMNKSEVRARALGLGLPVWDKEESQDICFVEEGDYAAVVRANLGEDHPVFRPGEIRDLRGNALGRHPGLVHYTVGQRRGLGLSGPDAYHVLRLETEENTLRVGTAEELGCRGVWVGDVRLQAPEAWLSSDAVEAKIRYRHAPAAAVVRVEGDRFHVRFDEPQRAVAPGQSCVVYRDGALLAGGRIDGPCGCCPPS
jgi:tRNA-specific 2-thiouridylase